MIDRRSEFCKKVKGCEVQIEAIYQFNKLTLVLSLIERMADKYCQEFGIKEEVVTKDVVDILNFKDVQARIGQVLEPAFKFPKEIKLQIPVKKENICNYGRVVTEGKVAGNVFCDFYDRLQEGKLILSHSKNTRVMLERSMKTGNKIHITYKSGKIILDCDNLDRKPPITVFNINGDVGLILRSIARLYDKHVTDVLWYNSILNESDQKDWTHLELFLVHQFRRQN